MFEYGWQGVKGECVTAKPAVRLCLTESLPDLIYLARRRV